ncbi:hypothetical protein [Acidisphaera rubrifaciens]|uniref:hypothetical protein n=1 Tax=Acidisphaera rubrifaciens TaxID=50715 RepID=UPI000662A9A0|nr:hypothetical protein [Acidisphaera rubrifaciens]
MVQRAFAVIAAVCLVGGIAIAMLLPVDAPLAQLIYAIDGDALDWVESGLRHALPAWAWTWIIMPLLIRPDWLLPISAGIVAAGLSVSLTRRPKTETARRRRS